MAEELPPLTADEQEQVDRIVEWLLKEYRPKWYYRYRFAIIGFCIGLPLGILSQLHVI